MNQNIMHRDKIKLSSYSHPCFCLLTHFCLNFKSTDVQTKLRDGFLSAKLKTANSGMFDRFLFSDSKIFR